MTHKSELCLLTLAHHGLSAIMKINEKLTVNNLLDPYCEHLNDVIKSAEYCHEM